MFLLYIALIVVLLVVGGWIGLLIWPRPFPAYDAPRPKFETVPLPDNLPPPVERYYRATFGDEVPVIYSAVITGRANLRLGPIPFLGRFRFTHEAGQNYRHYIEATLFGRPLLKVNERYLDGVGRMELPVGIIDDDPKMSQAANLGLWGESMWLPSIFLTDERVRWEPLDEHSARLIVPFEDEEETFTVHFDPRTGLFQRMEIMRWRDSKDATKTRWILEPQGWVMFNGIKLPSPASATWEPDGTPWLICHVEDVAFNADVSSYVRAHGL